MTSQSTLTTYATDLENLLVLRTHPIAIKVLTSEDEVPDGAIRPRRDRGEHYAVCQVFSLARRQGKTVAMFLEDHWCYAPIICYGLAETPASYLDGFTHGFFIADKEAARAARPGDDPLAGGQVPGHGDRPSDARPLTNRTSS